MAKKEYKVLSYKEFIQGRKLAEPGKYGKKKDPKWAVGAAKEMKKEDLEEVKTPHMSAAEEKFFKEKKCPKCGKLLNFGYRGSQNVKRCPELHYEKKGPFVRDE